MVAVGRQLDLHMMSHLSVCTFHKQHNTVLEFKGEQFALFQTNFSLVEIEISFY